MPRLSQGLPRASKRRELRKKPPEQFGSGIGAGRKGRPRTARTPFLFHRPVLAKLRRPSGLHLGVPRGDRIDLVQRDAEPNDVYLVRLKSEI